MNFFSLSRGMKQVFRTLGYRNYRLFFIGNGFSLIGNWMQQIALSWLVYRLTGSAFILGIVAFASLFPGFILTPLTGFLSDRWDRRSILLVSQTLAMLQAFALAFLVMTELIEVWHIMTLSVIIGLISAFDIPARQSYIVDLIGKREDLGSAIALNSALFNGARLLGPSLAGITIATLGEGICFLLNALSYGAIILALKVIKTEQIPAAGGGRHLLQGIKLGFGYAFGFLPIRTLLLLLSLVSLTGMPYAVLLPIYAKDIFHGGPHTLGFLTAASGVGALTAALYLASRRTVKGMEILVAKASGIFAIGLIFFSLSRVLWISFLLLVVAGFSMMVQLALSNTLLQTIVEDDLRGRVMGFFAMTFMGSAPVGSLIAGMLADAIGAPLTLLAGGVCCLAASYLYARKLPLLGPMIQAAYVKKGIPID